MHTTNEVAVNPLAIRNLQESSDQSNDPQTDGPPTLAGLLLLAMCMKFAVDFFAVSRRSSLDTIPSRNHWTSGQRKDP